MLTTKIKIDDHLAEYCIGKYGIDFTEPVRFPDYTDVYHTVYELTQKRPEDIFADSGNLEIVLPTKDREGEQIRKNPEVYNYISARSSRILNNKIKLMFWCELHELIDSERHLYGNKISDTIYIFMNKYRITKISEDALIKNYQRWRDIIRKKERRNYKKNSYLFCAFRERGVHFNM